MSELVKAPERALAPVEGTLPEVIEQFRAVAQGMSEARLLPARMTPPQATMVMLKGAELGLKPMQALADLYVVNGQVAMGTKTMCALYRSAGHSYTIDVTTAQECAVTFRLRNGNELSYTMTMDEVTHAKWDQAYDKEQKVWNMKPTWRAMPRVMLRYACLRTGIRAFAPEVLAGMIVVVEEAGGAETGAVLGEPLDEDTVDSTARDVTDEPLGEAGEHWSHDEAARKQVAEKMDKLALSTAEVYQALSMDAGTLIIDVEDYPKSLGNALVAMDNYTEAMAGTSAQQSLF